MGDDGLVSAPSRAADRAPVALGGGRRVLVVGRQIAELDDGAERRLREAGFSLRFAPDGAAAVQIAGRWLPDLALLALHPDPSEWIAQLGRAGRTACALVAVDCSEQAVDRANRSGADTLLLCPLDPAQVLRVVADRQPPATPRGDAREPFLPPLVVGSSPAMREVWRLALLGARGSSAVLVTGQTGAGKEVVARALHRFSSRRDRPFVALNCAAIPASLLESELFGHERGAFTGATERRRGRFERAHAGTLFLDEVGELPLGLQAKLLRVLQEQSFERVGGNERVDVDVRIVTATNRALGQAVERGSFRADLYYRLNVMTIAVPPLRERSADILPLWHHFVRRGAEREARPPPATDPQAERALLRHDWPGNVRELANAAQHALAICPADRVRERDLPAPLRRPGGEGAAAAVQQVVEQARSSLVGRTLESIEREAILQTYRAVGTVRGAAQLLGISERKMHYRLKAYREGSSDRFGDRTGDGSGAGG